MRRIILDTETTGLDFRTGDRIVEIGCIELYGRQRTGRDFHAYLNPGREVGEGAMAIHGLTNEFLADKPAFAAIADEFIKFVQGAEVVIHNAPFDSGFLDHELGLIGSITLAELCSRVIDTLQMARSLRPGRKNNLDALCAEFGIDNSSRQLHGALRDAELLAGVWLAMTRGQESLVLDPDMPEPERNAITTDRLPLKVLGADEAELLEHERVLHEIDKESKGRCV
ncbi:MAG: DNA polymerase III subunit epsilon, partial [Sphingobium sp.]|nr:DNA polymerase III subunit epsilon [Sphingobium sp.]